MIAYTKEKRGQTMAAIEPGRLKKLDRLYQHFEKVAQELAGYPTPHFFDYSKLFHFLKFHINNVGDPFQDRGNLKVQTLDIEREVIDRFADLFHAPKDDYWGYVTNGGTEGNLYGLYTARGLFPNSVVFYSDQTHYSIPKNLNLLRMPSVKIPSEENGEIDYYALQAALLKEKESFQRVPVIVANIGTTMKGAVDDLVRIKEILSDLKIDQYYIHCDAAFFGMILPFLPEIESQPFDFRIGIDSIAISGHKLIGTPFPCGVVLTKSSHVKKIGSSIEYVGIKDTTISGSRNGVAPLFLWFELDGVRKGKFQKMIQKCMDKASYAIRKFNELGVPAWRNKNSLIIIIPRPSDKTIDRWQLATEGNISHMITLQHVTYKVIDTIVKQVAADLKRPRKR